MEKWKTIEPGVWKPEKEGENITGVLVSKEPKDEKTGYSARYYLDTKEGMFLIWGSAVIDDRMQYVKIGDKIRITFDGKTKNKRNQDVNLFKIEKSENPQPAAENSDNHVEETLNTEQVEELF